MINNNYFTEDQDFQTLFKELVNWEDVVVAREGADFADAKKYAETGDERQAFAPGNVEDAVEYYRAVLESLGEISGKELAQKAQAMDQKGLKYADGQVEFPEESLKLFSQFSDAGLVPYNIAREYGGMGLPSAVAAMVGFIICRADLAFSMSLALLNLAQIVVRYGTPEQSEKYVSKMATGEYLGAMSLTEPNFGSDLGGVQTKAVKQEDGSYRLTGTKRFISQGCGLGDRPCVLLTMARTGSPTSGARGLSFFIVKSTDVEIAGIEKKMGIHASPTCEIVYDNTPAEIMGKEGFGLIRYTLGMTNFMRLGSAAAGAGIGGAALFEAQKYASEREQFGKTIEDIPAVGRMLKKLRSETNAMRLLSLEAGLCVDKYMHDQMRMEKAGKKDREINQNESIRYWTQVASFFTLISKYYCSEVGSECASIAVQVHGGAGYTEEYDVARIYRDARINTIYEGTTQLQVVGAIGSLSAGLKDTGFLRKYIDTEMAGFTASADLLELRELLEESVIQYRAIEDGVTRDTLAQEPVDTSVRFINGMLFERAVSRLSGETKSDWAAMAAGYLVDSIAIARGNLYRLKASV